MLATKAPSIFAMAARGMRENIEELLRTDPDVTPNMPDADGRTAMFHAQVHGHTHVADVLEQHGWTRMPEGNLWRGPGGRAMFWSGGVWATARPLAAFQHHANVTASNGIVRDNSAFVKAEQPRERDWRLQQRRQRRQYEYRHWGSNVLGPNHKLYMRKAVGGWIWGQAKSAKPSLNTRDYAEAYAKPDERTLVAEQRLFLDVDRVDVAEPHDAPSPAADAAPPRPTVGETARFIVLRKPTMLTCGTWVVPGADELLGDDAVACLCSADGAASMTPASDALAAIPEDASGAAHMAGAPDAAAAWPALPVRLPAMPTEWVLLRATAEPFAEDAASASESFADVGLDDDVSVVDSVAVYSELDSEVASLVDGADEPALAPELSAPIAASDASPPRRGVWGGAASTKAAVGFAAGAPAVFRARAKAAAAEAAASAEKEHATPEPFVDEDDDLCESAGLKDASHRVRGSHSASVKLTQKRAASMEKRAAQRGRR